MNRLLQVIFILIIACSEYTQAQPVKKQRIKEIVNNTYRNKTAYMQDSLHYVYSGKRGSRFVPYDFYAGSIYGYRSYYYPDQYDLAELPDPLYDLNSLNVSFDTCRQYYTVLTATGQVTVLAEKRIADYNADGRITRFMDGYQHQYGYNWSKNVYYDDQGRIEKVHHLVFDTLYRLVDTVSERIVTYDEENRLTGDSVTVSSSLYAYASQYGYDASGNVTSIHKRVHGGIWINETNRLLQYNEKGKLINEVTLLKNQAGGWDTSYVLLFTYDHKGRLFSYRSYQGGMVLPAHYYEMHYNELDLVDTFIRSDFFLGAQKETTRFFYNSYNNPDSAYTIQHRVDGTLDSVWNKTHYYYEEYEDSVIVLPPANKSPIIVYPNPSNGNMTIQWNSRKPSGPVYISIYSSNGNLARQVYIADIQTENKLKLPGLSSGVYYMRINTISGGLLHAQMLSINNDGG